MYYNHKGGGDQDKNGSCSIADTMPMSLPLQNLLCHVIIILLLEKKVDDYKKQTYADCQTTKQRPKPGKWASWKYLDSSCRPFRFLSKNPATVIFHF